MLPDEQRELLAVAAPVHRLEMARAGDQLLLRQDIAVGIEQRDDAGVPPEVGDVDLQARHDRAVLPDALRLRVADAHVLQQLAVACRT